ncbi:MAG: GTP-binding protein Der [Sulfuricurvum sp. MLSB]|uniref:ribosome biogenesis GTPase Der n=1 Tax=unclassified Sulfuricurvum TaxID=2632390 RepID=UPI0005009B32|nr:MULTISPECIES: ribosome biogenesis GTPase Der [unclassified Sulfuricurvum]KFN40515.1 MAG: GTP-binding protein Der [Sulfuricurvum sp. MLSB]
MKKLAIIGRPNVGKSSLFNRLLKQRDAITSEMAGTTRDVKKRIAVVLDKEVEILDTGGLDEGCELFDKIKEKSLKAAHEADIILFMVDGKSLPEEEDKKLFYELEAMGKAIALVVNKIDNDKMHEKLWEYFEFGTDRIFGISVAHNRHVNALLTWVAAQLPDTDIIVPEAQPDEMDAFDAFVDGFEDEEEFDEDEFGEGEEDEEDENEEFVIDEPMREIDESVLNQMKVAIIGRVNVGKSSLLNALLKEDRSVVSSVAGTTIDPIDEVMEYEGKTITFIDTAGIRKRGKILGIEKYALMRTEEMLEAADIALLVLDASEPFKDLDEKIAGFIDKNRLACLIVLNKWDLAPREDYDKIIQEVRDRFKFLSYAPIITISALTKQRVHKIFEMLLKINDNYSQRIPTSRINEILAMAQRKHPIPSINGHTIRLYYGTQYDIRPPRIALVMNKPQGLHFSYRRYLTNQFRELFDFEGTPVLFKAKSKNGNRRPQPHKKRALW